MSSRVKPTATPPPRARVAKRVAAAPKNSAGLVVPVRRTTERGERRREALLEAAQQVFLEHGYANASIEEVMQRVGGSKASLYSYFGNKEGLFGDMVTEGCERFLRDLAIPTVVEGDLEGTLRAFGMRFFKLYTNPQRVQLMRAIIAEATRFPDLARQFYENGPHRVRVGLSAFFLHCHRQGLMQAPNPDLAAIQFITLVKGHCQFRSLLGLSLFALPISPRAFVDYAVTLFLHGSARPLAARPARVATLKPVAQS